MTLEITQVKAEADRSVIRAQIFLAFLKCWYGIGLVSVIWYAPISQGYLKCDSKRFSYLPSGLSD